MNKNIKILLSILFLFYSNLYSQPQTEWVQRYNSPGNYNDYVTDMAIDKSGNVYLTGYVQVNDSDQNYVTIKYNSQGVEQWVRYYDGPDHREDKPVAIAVDDSGNVIVAGSSYSQFSSDDFLTLKYNSFGDIVWTRRNIDGLSMADMTLDNFGNVYVTGIKFGLNSEDILTIKYNINGDEGWEREFNGPTDQFDQSFSILVNRNNFIYISGGSLGLGGIVLRYDVNGNSLSLISGNNFVGNKILLDTNLNIFLGFDS
ncbi:MAG TPA: SBBP repeat-containing protein [Ignavibacteria bacterium]|nr:SBBP repeat-containing protein [Ignavibacteria bacterium]